MSYESSSSLFSANVAGTLRMIAYLGMACVLMVLDHHFHLLKQVRHTGAVAVEPMFMVASMPSRLVNSALAAVAERRSLQAENRQLRSSLMLAEVRINRMRGLVDQNRRYRQLLDVQEQLDFSVQTARLVGVDLGPYRHRVLINVGSVQGVKVGMTVMDAHGVMGQVVELGRTTAQVMLITDPNHAIPVVDQRTNLRLIARGTGRPDRLRIQAIPLSADVQAGDRLLTSGLGGRFPAGFPVARITEVRVGADGMFAVALAEPAADLGKSSEVLLLRDQPIVAGPPAPAPAFGPPAELAADAARTGRDGGEKR